MESQNPFMCGGYLYLAFWNLHFFLGCWGPKTGGGFKMFSVVSHCFTPKRWGRLSGVNDYFFWLVQPSSIYETRCQQHCLIYLDIACTQRCPKPWLRMMRIKRRIRTRRATERAKPSRTRPGDPIILPHPLGPMANRGAMGPTLAPWRSGSFRQGVVRTMRRTMLSKVVQVIKYFIDEW